MMAHRFPLIHSRPFPFYPDNIILFTKFFFILLAVIVLFTGCVSTRGIPSHGGGKRFDEEQRMLVSAMKQAIARMDLHELQCQKVKIISQAMPSTGGGNVAWGGLQNFSTGFNLSRSSDDYVFDPSSHNYDVGRDITGGGLNTNWSPNLGYNSQMAGTDGDVNYLISNIEMKCRQENILLGKPAPAYTLFVLVDVLGINRSRKDYLIVKKENYLAVCEITYYVMEEKSGQLLFGPQRVVGGAEYCEEYNIFTGSDHVTRELIVPEAACFITEAAKIAPFKPSVTP